jgi:hypothetical protein
MSVTVAEEGNRRMGDMSGAESIQCATDIKSWFQRTDCVRYIKNGASSVDFQRLEKSIDTELPNSLKILLAEANGGIYFLDKKMMGTEDIASCVSKFERSRDWKAGLIPFCGDDETLLVIDTRNYDGVYEWDTSDGLGDMVAPTMEKYLEDYRNSLLGGHFEFVEDIGVIEKMGGKTVSTGRK